MKRKALAVAQDIGSGDKPLDCRVFPITLIESLAMSESMGVGSTYWERHKQPL